MMLRILFVISLLGVVASAPETYVKWMEIVKAKPAVRERQSLPVDFVSSYQPYNDAWSAFKEKHGKSYEATEEERRRKIFEDNVAYIEEHNKKYLSGHTSFYLGLNHVSDMDFEEYKKLNGYRGESNTKRHGSSYVGAAFVTLPDSIDWRQHGYVTGVKDQGSCGSCWSFSATGSLEGQHFKLTHKLISLSEQQLVDCSDKYGNHGCNGGLMDQAFDYIKDIGGINSEKSYPYLAKQALRCYFKRSAISATCTGHVDIAEGSEGDLKQATATIGPISVAIDAGHRSFQLYQGGVYDEPECSSTQLDHGVLVVGYGTEEGSDYWLVKNSWSAKWGDQGYVKMSRNNDNQCGIATKASYPLV